VDLGYKINQINEAIDSVKKKKEDKAIVETVSHRLEKLENEVAKTQFQQERISDNITTFSKYKTSSFLGSLFYFIIFFENLLIGTASSDKSSEDLKLSTESLGVGGRGLIEEVKNSLEKAIAVLI